MELKERKKTGRSGRRILGMLLAAALVFANIDLSLVARAAEPGSIKTGGEGPQLELSTKEDLEQLRDSEGKNFILTKDIDLEGSEENPWIPIPDFKGILDGNGHTIRGIYIDWGGNESNNTNQGLFALNSGTVKNLRVEGSITTEFYVGGIAGSTGGYNRWSGKVIDCINDGTIYRDKDGTNQKYNMQTHCEYGKQRLYSGCHCERAGKRWRHHRNQWGKW